MRPIPLRAPIIDVFTPAGLLTLEAAVFTHGLLTFEAVFTLAGLLSAFDVDLLLVVAAAVVFFWLADTNGLHSLW